MDKRQFWHFSKEKDIEQTADDPTSGRPAQPDHFPNVVRPGGGYPEGRGEKTDAFCNKCKDQLIDGSCLRCDWGPQNRSVPVEDFPLDPFDDDKAGIRAASWKFSKMSQEEWEKRYADAGWQLKGKIKNAKSPVKAICPKGHKVTVKRAERIVCPRPECNKRVLTQKQWEDKYKSLGWTLKGKIKRDGQGYYKPVKAVCPKGHSIMVKEISRPGCYICKPPQKTEENLGKHADFLKKNHERIKELSNQGLSGRAIFTQLYKEQEDEFPFNSHKDDSIGRAIDEYIKIKQIPKGEKRINRWRNALTKNKKELAKDVQDYIFIKLENPEYEDLFDYNKYYDLCGVEDKDRKKFREFIKEWIILNNLVPEKIDESAFRTLFRARQSTDENYVYFIQSGSTVKIGWSGHLSDRMQTHEKGGQQRAESKDPQINQIIYNLETGRANNVPGAVIVGPVKEEQVARATEQQIKNWFKKQMEWTPISKEEQADGFTETFKITVAKENKYPAPGRPESLGPTSVARFTPDAMAEVMQTLIGHIMQNNGVMTPLDEESQYEIALSFGFDQDLLNQLFGTDFGASLGFDETVLDYAPIVNRFNRAWPESFSETDPNFEGSVPPPIEVGPNLEEGIQQPQQPLYERPTSPYQRTINEQGRQQEIANMLQNGLAYQDEQGNIIDVKTDQIISKTADYQGWTNWETWNTKLMIDNDYEPYMQSRQLVQNFTPINQFAMWATETILAPHNQQALADAQEWNEIPYDERPTGREDISEGGQALIESFDEIFDMDPRSDETAQIIDESKVNWNEIYNSIGEDIKESERFAHEEGKHDLLVSDYMTEYSAPELAEAQAGEHPWCPVCNVEKPDDPGTTTLPPDWTS